MGNQVRPKRNFTESVHERNLVNKIVYSIKMGWMKPKPLKAKMDQF